MVPLFISILSILIPSGFYVSPYAEFSTIVGIESNHLTIFNGGNSISPREYSISREDVVYLSDDSSVYKVSFNEESSLPIKLYYNKKDQVLLFGTESELYLLEHKNSIVQICEFNRNGSYYRITQKYPAVGHPAILEVFNPWDVVDFSGLKLCHASINYEGEWEDGEDGTSSYVEYSFPIGNDSYGTHLFQRGDKIFVDYQSSFNSYSGYNMLFLHSDALDENIAKENNVARVVIIAAFIILCLLFVFAYKKLVSKKIEKLVYTTGEEAEVEKQNYSAMFKLFADPSDRGEGITGIIIIILALAWILVFLGKDMTLMIVIGLVASFIGIGLFCSYLFGIFSLIEYEQEEKAKEREFLTCKKCHKISMEFVELSVHEEIPYEKLVTKHMVDGHYIECGTPYYVKGYEDYSVSLYRCKHCHSTKTETLSIFIWDDGDNFNYSIYNKHRI